jgi:hypothetical protein
MTHEKLIKKICDHYSIDQKWIRNYSQSPKIVKIKREMIFVLYNFLDYEVFQMQQIFDLSRQSIKIALETIQTDFENDKKYRQLLISYLDEN